MLKNCDICGCNRTDPYCIECGWDFSENESKKNLFIKAFARKKALSQQQTALKTVTDSLEEQKQEVETKLKSLPAQIEQLSQQKELIINELHERERQNQRLKELEIKLSTFNYLFDRVNSNPALMYEGRKVRIRKSETNSTIFDIEANFKQKPSLLLVLSRRRFGSLATGTADYFLPLEQEIVSHGNNWRLTIPKNLFEGRYWVFFTSFHAAQKCIIDPLQQYEIHL